MKKSDLIQAVETRRGTSSYGVWTIGVTDDPQLRKDQHNNDGKDVQYWTQWRTDSESDGRDTEKYFLDRGMKGGTGGGGYAKYVYIF